MDQNQPIENALQTPPKKTSRLRTALILAGLVLALLLLKLILILTAKPKVTVDYVQELNRITKPQNYDPNQNAAHLYQKAFDSFVDIPAELRKPYITWPTDYNSTNQALLEKWLASNSQAFKHFRIATSKPYYWLQRKPTQDNWVNSILTPELAKLRHLTEALGWNAKLNASKKRFRLAFDDTIYCYRAGRQKSRTPSLIMEQLIGLAFKRSAVSDALTILDRTVIDNSILQYFQDALHTELNEDAYAPDLQVENLILLDAVQRVFVHSPAGTGRLAWRVAHYFDTLGGVWPNRIRRLNCFVGPTRNDVIAQIEHLHAIFDAAKNQTPWQLHSQKSEHFTQIESINNSNFFFQLLGLDLHRIFQLHHETRTGPEALITVLAILRFKNDNDQLPRTLDELFSTGYIESVPIDPYSGRALVYKLVQGNFKLYSFGSNFEDNGGTYRTVAGVALSLHTGRIITGEESGDIVYWPVKQPERPKPAKQLPLTGFPPSPYEPNQKDN